MNDVLGHWSSRWSLLCRVDDRWHVYVPSQGPDVSVRPVRWWSPRDLVRFPIYWYWRRRFW